MAFARLSRTLSDRSVSDENLLAYLNRQLIPVVRNLRQVVASSVDILAGSVLNQTLIGDGADGAAWDFIRDAYVAADAAISVSKLAAGTATWILQTVGTTPTWVSGRPFSGSPLTDPVTLAFKTTAGTADAVGYLVPASPSGINRFSHHRTRCRLKEAIVGTGNVVLRAGTTVGGNDLLVDSVAWDSATPIGTEIGISIADFGTAPSAAKGYVKELDAGASTNIRATTTGTLSAGSVEIFTYGASAS